MSKEKNEIIGNFEIAEGKVKTRREVLMMGAMAAGTLMSLAPANAENAVAAGNIAVPSKSIDEWVAKDFSHLVKKPMTGLTANQIEQHLKLYKGYIGKSNEIHNKLKDVDLTSANATYSPLRELLMEQSYAVNGAVYHEFYFGNLGGTGGEPTGDLKAALESHYGSIGKFMDFLKASGKSMRGWVVVGYNTRDGHIHTYGLDMHNMWSPTNVIPILVLDVYEHAYMIDYGIDRGKYLDAFCNNLDWNIVSKRLAQALKQPSGDIATA